MKLNRHFIVHSDGGETLLVPTAEADFSGIVRGNKTFGTILGLLENEITQEEIVRALCERFEADEGVIEADVAEILEQLRSVSALDE